MRSPSESVCISLCQAVWERKEMRFRRFVLVRDEDETGLSGTGVVAEGVQFSTGRCVLAWVTQYPSIAFYNSTDEIRSIHGHDGRTEVSWLDSQCSVLLEPEVCRSRRDTTNLSYLSTAAVAGGRP